MDDDGCLKEGFNGIGEKQLTAESSAPGLLDSNNASVACGSDRTPSTKDFHRENAITQVVERSNSEKKKRVSRITGGGLRQFSVIVCKKLESKGRTTYSEVADEIIAEFSGTLNETVASLDEFDEKNIRRRVYDALNVLMAMEIISRDKKEIQWKGLPTTDIKEVEELKAHRMKLKNRIGKKAAYLKDLNQQIAGIECLVSRNKQLLSSRDSPLEGFSLPFLLVQTSSHATVEIEISEDMQLVHFDFNSTPFSLHDDAYILKLLRSHQLQESRLVSQSSSVLSSSSSGIASGGTKPFHWNSEAHTSHR